MEGRVISHYSEPSSPAAAPLGQRVRHDGPDRHLPITGRGPVRCLARCLVRCFDSLPGAAKPAPAEAGSLNARRNRSFEPKTLNEKRKRAAGIEPASSAWKAEVLPLNYARNVETTTLAAGDLQIEDNRANGLDQNPSGAIFPRRRPNCGTDQWRRTDLRSRTAQWSGTGQWSGTAMPQTWPRG
ncbi:MAG: hypothetical protein RLZZ117_1995 [Cyanobacteriota bacterium]